MIRFTIITGMLLGTFGLAAYPTQAQALGPYGNLRDFIELAPGRPSFAGNTNPYSKRSVRNPENRDRRLRDVPAVAEFYESRS